MRTGTPSTCTAYLSEAAADNKAAVVFTAGAIWCKARR